MFSQSKNSLKIIKTMVDWGYSKNKENWVYNIKQNYYYYYLIRNSENLNKTILKIINSEVVAKNRVHKNIQINDASTIVSDVWMWVRSCMNSIPSLYMN